MRKQGGTGEDNISSEDSEDHSGVSQALRQYHLAGGGMLCGLGDSISSDSDRSSSSKNNGDSRSSSSSSQSSSRSSNTKNNGNSSPYSPPPSQRQHHRSRTVDHTKASVVRLAHEWVLYERSGSGLRLKYQVRLLLQESNQLLRGHCRRQFLFICALFALLPMHVHREESTVMLKNWLPKKRCESGKKKR